MKIVVVGPGAIGCLFGGILAEAGNEVWLLDERPERAKKISHDGIYIEESGKSRTIQVQASVDPAKIGDASLVILCVKSFDTEPAAKNLPSLLSEDGCVLTIQNGVGNVEILGQVVGMDRVIGGVTSQGATLLGDGKVRHAGKGETIIGSFTGMPADGLESICATLNSASLPTSICDDPEGVIWSKLMVNVAINALTALTRLNNGRLVESDATRDLLRLAVEEAVTVAKKKCIKLIYDDPLAQAESVCRATAANVSSMLQDVLSQRRTEIDFINGVIVKEGSKLGLPTPVNVALTNLVKALESTYDLQVTAAPE